MLTISSDAKQQEEPHHQEHNRTSQHQSPHRSHFSSFFLGRMTRFQIPLPNQQVVSRISVHTSISNRNSLGPFYRILVTTSAAQLPGEVLCFKHTRLMHTLTRPFCKFDHGAGCPASDRMLRPPIPHRLALAKRVRLMTACSRCLALANPRQLLKQCAKLPFALAASKRARVGFQLKPTASITTRNTIIHQWSDKISNKCPVRPCRALRTCPS